MFINDITNNCIIYFCFQLIIHLSLFDLDYSSESTLTYIISGSFTNNTLKSIPQTNIDRKNETDILSLSTVQPKSSTDLPKTTLRTEIDGKTVTDIPEVSSIDPEPKPTTTDPTPSTTTPITTTTTTTTSPTTTTKAPTTTTKTTTLAPNTSTTPKPSTIAPTKTPVIPTTEAPHSGGRHFDGSSFVGGIVLTCGLLAIAFVSWKFYKARTERNYHTL